MQLHPLCSLFPRMEGAEFEALKEDIRAHGLRHAITTLDGMVLDGGNRYRACVEVGVEPETVEFSGDNIVSFVLSANLHRRHMDAGQRSAIVSTAANWAKANARGGDRRSDQSRISDFDSVNARAEVSGSHRTTQMQADKLAREHPKAAQEVAQGKKSLYRAVQETKPAPAKTAREMEAERIADEAHGGTDPLEEWKRAQAEVESLQAQVDALSTDDQKAETLKALRMRDAAVRGQHASMEDAAAQKRRAAFYEKQLARCGKAVGERDLDKVAAAVEALVRRYREAA